MWVVGASSVAVVQSGRPGEASLHAALFTFMGIGIPFLHFLVLEQDPAKHLYRDSARQRDVVITEFAPVGGCTMSELDIDIGRKVVGELAHELVGRIQYSL